MDSASWTLLFLVPTSYVATNTVALINTTVHIVLIFAVIMLVVTSVVVYIILQIRDCLEAGMDAHIAKPIDIDLLERAMRAFYPPETSNK